MNNIEISAIVPCYNSEKHLERCLKSLINQEYDNYKIVAYDNESTDSTPEILMSYKEKYPDKISIIDIPNISSNFPLIPLFIISLAIFLYCSLLSKKLSLILPLRKSSI